jgi:manganese/zinc/iron transport system permease protein
MTLTSITAVTSLDCVGAIVTVAVMITPAASAFLLTNHLPTLIKLSLIIGISNSWLGYIVAHYYDLSLAGSIATLHGIVFFIILIAAPKRGLYTTLLQRSTKNKELDCAILVHYLFKAKNNRENRIIPATHNLGWSHAKIQHVAERAQQQQLIFITGEFLLLTPQGGQFAENYYKNPHLKVADLS